MSSRTGRRGVKAVVATACMAVLCSVGLVATPASASESRQRFIVTVSDAFDARSVAGEHRRKGAKVDFVYSTALNGFAGSMSAADLGRLQRDGRVTRIERDGVATASETQVNATWGLDRTDQRALPLSGTYDYASTGTGVNAYIVDTGIRRTHGDFGGRVAAQYFDAFTDGKNGDDCNGHGTHVAGTVGGAAYGVAKAVALYPVRVLDCNGSGSWSGVIAGLDWVAANHVKPAVANMSLGGGASTSVDDAVNRTIAAGVSVVVAAGNGDRNGREQDACNYSPARVPAAITIGATTQTDSKTSFSNYGSCVDLFAPGAGITSAWYTSDTSTNTISGTSMASPHVAGVAALHLQSKPGDSPALVRDAVYAATTKGIVTSSKTANNHLLHSAPPVADVTPNAAPTASFTYTCTDLGCTFDGSGSADSDGSIASYAWTFGDGGTGTGATPSHTYAAGGTYSVALTVTDNAGATGTTSQPVTVTAPTGTDPAPEPATITLGASGYKAKGVKHVDLTWSGATSTSVDVFRDRTRVATTANDGAHTDSINTKGGGSYTYRVCEAGTSTCSGDVTVVF